MIKAVFFDWFNTLARYEPPREELGSIVLRELGFDVSPDALRPAIAVADRRWYEENTRSAIRKRSPSEQALIYARYQQTVLDNVGIDTGRQPEMIGKVVSRMQELSKGMRFVLFDDVIPVLENLKDRGFIIGLITNVERGMEAITYELGLDACIDVIVTSGDVGKDKPSPAIFLAALERAQVKASEAVHVGDQYDADVVGARGVGIAPVLLDRYGLTPGVVDCPRLRSLKELDGYLA